LRAAGPGARSFSKVSDFTSGGSLAGPLNRLRHHLPFF
jgi:hypothetical protein